LLGRDGARPASTTRYKDKRTDRYMDVRTEVIDSLFPKFEYIAKISELFLEEQQFLCRGC